MKKYNSRGEVEEKYKWDLTEFFKDEKDFDTSYQKCSSMIKGLSQYKGKLKNPEVLKEFLDQEFTMVALLYRLAAYTYIVNDQELGNSKSIVAKQKADNLMSAADIATSFFSPEILAFSDSEYEAIINNELLKDYHKLINEVYRFKKHILPEKEEAIISELINATNHYEDMSSEMVNSEHNYGTVNIDGEKVQVTQTNFRYLLRNPDEKIRKAVRKKILSKMGEYDVSAASILNGYVKTSLTNARLHHYEDVLDEVLFGLELPKDLYNILIKNVEARTSSLQNYYQVFKTALKLDELKASDLYLEISKSDKEYTVEETQELLLKALKPLGNEYIKQFKVLFDKRCIDYMGYPGKKSGGYSMSTFDTNSRILMSFNGDFESVTTIAHEGGHAVNFRYINDNNPMPYREPSTLVCEIASLTNECLLSHYVLNNSSNLEEKITGINNLINLVLSYLFGAVREGTLEVDFYNHVKKGNAITADYMNKICNKSYKKFYGNVVKQDKYSKYTWINRSHYFNNYYLFSYAFSVLAALNISKEIIAGNKEMLDKYLKFLKCGSDTTVLETYQVLGFDLTNDDFYQNAIDYFDEVVNDLSKLIDERK